VKEQDNNLVKKNKRYFPLLGIFLISGRLLKNVKTEVSRKTGMGNKTECTGFLARATIKPETKAGLDKTESIMVPLVQKAFPEMELSC
jgi:hypothetical protein